MKQNLIPIALSAVFIALAIWQALHRPTVQCGGQKPCRCLSYLARWF